MSKIFKFFVVFISSILLLGVIILPFRSARYFVPFVSFHNHVVHFNSEQPLVTLTEFYPILKKKFHSIESTSIDLLPMFLNKHYTAILPWDVDAKALKALKVNDLYYYESKEGAFLMPVLSLNDSNYDQFLSERNVLGIGGTVVLSRGVGRVIDKHDDVLFPWRGTNHIFKSSDFNIVNFKSPLIRSYETPDSSWLLYGKEPYVEGLVKSNINLVSISGNHMGDAGVDGLIETIDLLTSNNILSVGAGRKNIAYQCQRIKIKNQVFGFLGFNNVWGSIGKATDDKVGIAWLDNDALSATASCSQLVDTLVIMVNWGIEYQHIPRVVEKEWAQKLANHGADIIVGDQAHWVQNHEAIGAAHVSYGLGNYIFDQHWSENTTEGIIQKFVFYQKKLFYVDTIPVKLQKDGQVFEIDSDSARFQYVMSVYHDKN